MAVGQAISLGEGVRGVGCVLCDLSEYVHFLVFVWVVNHCDFLPSVNAGRGYGRPNCRRRALLTEHNMGPRRFGV
ncbi:protein of unknown function [Aminobacter niigataensis]|nr:protein of unknown function [Aminobacter niigataensis]